MKDGRYMLFNTFSRSKLFVDDELKEVIETGHFDKVDTEMVEQLRRCGVVIDDTADEFKKFTDLYHKRVYTPFEYEFTIIPTYDCNVACYYCNHSNKTLSHKLLEKLKVFFSKELEKSECKNVAVRIAGGEPLLHPELVFEILEELSCITEEYSKNFFSALATNGTLLTKKVLERLSFLNAVQVTFEGCRSYHDQVRHDYTGTFDRIITSAEMVLNAGIVLNVRVHVSQESIPGLGELFRFLHSSGILGSHTMITAAPVVTTTICPLYPSKCTESEAASLLPQAWEKAKKCGVSLSGMPSPAYERLACPYVTPTSLIVDPAGTIYKCLMAANEKTDAAGSLKGFHSPISNVLDFKGTECEECSFLVLCGGYCTWRQCQSEPGGCKTRSLLAERVKFHLKNTYPLVE